LQVKREAAGKKMAKTRKPAMAKRKAPAVKSGRSAGKMAGTMPKAMKSAMPQDMKVCQKPHDMEHYRLSDEDDACFDSVR